MRACFLKQSVCSLGFGVAVVQTLPAEDKPPAESAPNPPLDAPVPLPPNRMFAELKRQPHFS